MDLESSPAYLQSVFESVGAFQSALTDFLALHTMNDWLARGVAPAVFPRDDVSAEQIKAATTRVGREAGRASDAASLTNMFIVVQGAGRIDPIAAWQTITQPKPLLEPDDVIGACEQIRGRLEAMIRRADAIAPPTIGAAAMHPLVWGASSKMWRDGHFRAAVAAAADALVGVVKARSGRNDVSETALWQEVFSSADPVAGKPRFRWPGEPADRDVKTMNDGLRQFAPGVQMTIRNPAAHGQDEMGEQDALERLAVLSLLARWLDTCELVEVSPT
jgi:hypothetical protein